MKKRSAVILLTGIIIALMCPAIFVSADVLWEPNDSFYERNREKCTYLARSFYANGVGGFISLKTEPGANREVAKYENGTVLHIQFTYDHNGDTWGIGYDPGWVRMDQLLLKYDSISFDEEHGHEFYAFTSSIDPLFEHETLIFWTWPGSGEIAMAHEPLSSNRELESNWLTPPHVYRDSEDREWGYVPYFYARRSTWVCISDSSNNEIPAFNAAPEPEFRPPGGAGSSPDDLDGSSTGWLSTPLLIVILVIVVAVASAVLIRTFWKKKDKGDIGPADSAP